MRDEPQRLYSTLLLEKLKQHWGLDDVRLEYVPRGAGSYHWQALTPGGEGWLVLSDLAEHLGLRASGEVEGLVEAAGLRIVARSTARPLHPKAADASDPLHAARSREVTSLWRLALP